MRSFMLLIKPAGPDCNLDCRYCFYSGKASRFGSGAHRMSEDVLEAMVRDYLGLGFPVNNFAWQGGEPTLMGLDFFRRVMELQQQYGQDGQAVGNALQTNGILLDSKWCRFLHDYNFLLGISLDGPQHLHDHYRRTRGGKGTYEQVMTGIVHCRAHRVEFNVLVLLNDRNVAAPDELFDFFVEQEFLFLQFIPCVEKDSKTNQPTEYSITPQQYGDFLCRIFDRWMEYGPDKLSIRLFDSVMSYYVNGRHSNCTFGPRCDDYVVVEHNGDVFCCDFYVEDKWRLGNLLDKPVGELYGSERKREFARRKTKVSNKCFICRYFPVCRGGCPKDREVLSGDAKALNYYCASYKQFFDHASTTLMQLPGQYHQSRDKGHNKGR